MHADRRTYIYPPLDKRYSPIISTVCGPKYLGIGSLLLPINYYFHLVEDIIQCWTTKQRYMLSGVKHFHAERRAFEEFQRHFSTEYLCIQGYVV